MENAPLLSEVEQTRVVVSKVCDSRRKSQFSQFFTPVSIAQYMAGLFSRRTGDTCRLLDPGAGIGPLSAAFLGRCVSGDLGFNRIEVDTFEIDDYLHPYLTETLDKYRGHLDVISAVRGDDFIHAAVDSVCGNLFGQSLPQYTHAILNPPYKKIRSNSSYRLALRKVGIETVNLYSAFVALSVLLLEERGQLVAIIPRSFCNGPYYRSFREFLMRRAAIRHMHLFASRKTVFKGDEVLQENVIIMLERGVRQGDVTVTTSTDDSFADLEAHEYSFDTIVFPEDQESFIHIPTSPDQGTIERSSTISCALQDVGLMVSTGPVVDFRVKEYLRDMPEVGTVPLLYPAHFGNSKVAWPKRGSKRPNAIQRNLHTEKWLYPNGFYCVVRRFSSKEEKRRVVASVVNPSVFAGADALAFENHLNVFHEDGHGVPEALARGLAAFLNTTAVDEHFRRFSGHTQVNATDLRLIKYPSREALIALGEWATRLPSEPTQGMLDNELEELA